MTDVTDPSPGPAGWRRWARAAAVAVLLGGAVSVWTAFALGSPHVGPRLVFDFWAGLWGGFAAVVGFGVGAWGRAGRRVVGLALATLVVVVTWGALTAVP